MTLVVTVFMLCTSALACPQCYTQAASSGERLVAALRSGIFFLIIPALSVLGGIAVMAWKRNRPSGEADRDYPDPGW
jgi:hypothetical protein